MYKTKYISWASIALFIINGCTPEPTISDFNQYNISVDKELLNISTSNAFSSDFIDKKHKKKRYKHNSNTPPIINANIDIFDGNQKVSSLTNSKQTIKLSVDDITIPKFTKLVFGQILKYNFIIDDKVENSKKTISLNITNPISKKEFILIIKKLYQANGFYIEKSNGVYHIKYGRNKNTIDENLYKKVIYGTNIPQNIKQGEVISIFIPYHYVRLSRMKTLFKHFLSKNSYQHDFKSKNVYFVRDSVENIKKLLRFVKVIDIPTMKNRYTTLIHLEHISSEEFLNNLKDILPSSGIKIAKSIEDLGIVIKNIKTLNSLFVVSENKKWIKILKYWKEQLDIIDINSDERKFFVYKPKNRIAKDLKVLIDGLLQKQDKKIIPLDKKNIQKTDNLELLENANIQVIEDTNRNMLIIHSTPSEYKALLEMLNQLDILPKQVLIEVTIAELTLKDSLEYGFEWYLQNNAKTGILSTLGGLGLGGAGLSGSIIKSSQSLQLYMNLFAQKNLINILSSPKLVVANNQPASLNVGTEVPILNSSSSTVNPSGDQTLSQSVEYRKTGIILNVTPTIHSNNSLVLKISQVVSEAQANSVSDISSPILLNRNITTNVVLKSGQTLLLGGLIRENKSTTESKVPFFSDIPVVGELFQTKQHSGDKTELIVMIKPIVLNNTAEANLITNTFQNMLHH